MKKDRLNKKIAAAAAAVILIAALIVRCGLTPSSGNGVSDGGKPSEDEITEGVDVITELSEKDPEKVDEELDYYRKSQQLEFYEADNYEAIYDDCMIMGDSHAEGFTSYGLLPGSMVAADVGRDVNNNDEDRAAVIAAKPEKLYLVYGQNTIQRSNGDAQKAADKYKEFLDYMQEKLPDTEMIVCSVFQPQESILAEKPGLANVPQLNSILKQMCADNGWTFVDTTQLLTDQYYEPDHIHTNKAFHKLWLGYVASETGLLDLDVEVQS